MRQRVRAHRMPCTHAGRKAPPSRYRRATRARRPSSGASRHLLPRKSAGEGEM